MTFASLLLLFHLTLVLSFTLIILIRDDLTPTTRLTWFALLMVVPAIGCLLYILFGVANLGKKLNQRSQTVVKSLFTQHSNLLGDPAIAESHIDRSYLAPFRYAASINGFCATRGNVGELMADAQTARSRMIEDIDAATSTVNVLYYIWLSDQTGVNMAEALIRAAQRGVNCRAMVDGLGSRVFVRSKWWKKMQQAGVQLAVALPINRPIYTIITSRLDLRNHRKITVIDNCITYCGSQNCADREYAVKPKYAPWIDIMLRFEGPVAAQNQLLFASDWLLKKDGPLGQSVEQFAVQPSPVADDGIVAQIVGDGPTERDSSTPQLFSTLIESAVVELTISTPYFVPDQTVLEALCSAAFRGVRVKLIFPLKNDSWVVSAASRSYYRKLLRAGVQLYEFKPGLLHSKTLTIDGTLSFVGSSNMDLRSFDLNYENNILFTDRELTQSIRQRQMEYMQDSVLVKLDEVEQWSILQRVWNNVVATVGPVL